MRIIENVKMGSMPLNNKVRRLEREEFFKASDVEEGCAKSSY